MRKQQLMMFVSLLVLTAMAAAQTPSRLDRVDVVRGSDDVKIEMKSSGAITPKVTALDTPTRLVVDLPATGMATGRNHIAVGASSVKGVRIGTDAQVPPTTRIVVDLNEACTYDLTPGPADKLVLTVHSVTAAKAAPVRAPAPSVAPGTGTARGGRDRFAKARCDFAERLCGRRAEVSGEGRHEDSGCRRADGSLA